MASVSLGLRSGAPRRVPGGGEGGQLCLGSIRVVHRDPTAAPAPYQILLDGTAIASGTSASDRGFAPLPPTPLRTGQCITLQADPPSDLLGAVILERVASPTTPAPPAKRRRRGEAAHPPAAPHAAPTTPPPPPPPTRPAASDGLGKALFHDLLPGVAAVTLGSPSPASPLTSAFQGVGAVAGGGVPPPPLRPTGPASDEVMDVLAEELFGLSLPLLVEAVKQHRQQEREDSGVPADATSDGGATAWLHLAGSSPQGGGGGGSSVRIPITEAAALYTGVPSGVALELPAPPHLHDSLMTAFDALPFGASLFDFNRGSPLASASVLLIKNTTPAAAPSAAGEDAGEEEEEEAAPPPPPTSTPLPLRHSFAGKSVLLFQVDEDAEYCLTSEGWDGEGKGVFSPSSSPPTSSTPILLRTGEALFIPKCRLTSEAAGKKGEKSTPDDLRTLYVKSEGCAAIAVAFDVQSLGELLTTAVLRQEIMGELADSSAAIRPPLESPFLGGGVAVGRGDAHQDLCDFRGVLQRSPLGVSAGFDTAHTSHAFKLCDAFAASSSSSCDDRGANTLRKPLLRGTLHAGISPAEFASLTLSELPTGLGRDLGVEPLRFETPGAESTAKFLQKGVMWWSSASAGDAPQPESEERYPVLLESAYRSVMEASAPLGATDGLTDNTVLRHGESEEGREYFPVHFRKNRQDMGQSLDGGPTHALLNHILRDTPVGGAIQRILGNARLVEFSCLLSHPGSAGQPPHSDSTSRSLGATSAAHLISCFVPLLDVGELMGPLEVWPGTHSTLQLIPGSLGYLRSGDGMQFREFISEAEEAEADARAADGSSPARLPVNPALSFEQVRMTVPRGSVVMMDSRCYHRGSSNTSLRTRPVCYFTFASEEGSLPEGSTYSLSEDLKGKGLRLSDFLLPQGPTAPTPAAPPSHPVVPKGRGGGGSGSGSGSGAAPTPPVAVEVVSHPTGLPALLTEELHRGCADSVLSRLPPSESRSGAMEGGGGGVPQCRGDGGHDVHDAIASAQESCIEAYHGEPSQHLFTAIRWLKEEAARLSQGSGAATSKAGRRCGAGAAAAEPAPLHAVVHPGGVVTPLGCPATAKLLHSNGVTVAVRARDPLAVGILSAAFRRGSPAEEEWSDETFASTSASRVYLLGEPQRGGRPVFSTKGRVAAVAAFGGDLTLQVWHRVGGGGTPDTRGSPAEEVAVPEGCTARLSPGCTARVSAWGPTAGGGAAGIAHTHQVGEVGGFPTVMAAVASAVPAPAALPIAAACPFPVAQSCLRGWAASRWSSFAALSMQPPPHPARLNTPALIAAVGEAGFGRKRGGAAAVRLNPFADVFPVSLPAGGGAVSDALPPIVRLEGRDRQELARSGLPAGGQLFRVVLLDVLLRRSEFLISARSGQARSALRAVAEAVADARRADPLGAAADTTYLAPPALSRFLSENCLYDPLVSLGVLL